MIIFRSILIAAMLLVLLGCVQSGDLASSAFASETLQAPKGALMIVIDDPRSERRRRGIGSPGYAASLAYQDDPALKRAAVRMATDHNLTLISHWPLRNLAVHCLVVEAPASSAMQALDHDDRVRWIQPFNEFDTQAVAGPVDGLASSAPSARTAPRRSIRSLFSSISEQGAGVRIAVVDTAIDESHPDLSASTVQQTNFAGQRGRPGVEEHGTAAVSYTHLTLPTTPYV